MTTSNTSTVSGIELSLKHPDKWKQFHPQTEMIVTRKDISSFIIRGKCLVTAMKLDWMEKPVSFEHVRITNNPDLKNSNTFLLQSMHKFVPVIGIQKMGDSKIEAFPLGVTEFMAVTAYQSTDIIALKTKLNKFARGKDLPSGSAKSSRGTKRPATFPAELPSPPSSSVPSSLSPPHLPSETVSPPTVQGSPEYSRLPSIESMLHSATHSGYQAPASSSPLGTQATGYPYCNFENVQVPPNNEYQIGQMQMHQMNEMSWYPMDMHQGMRHRIVPAMPLVTPVGMTSEMSCTLNGNFPPMVENNLEEIPVLTNLDSWNIGQSCENTKNTNDMANLDIPSESPYYQ